MRQGLKEDVKESMREKVTVVGEPTWNLEHPIEGSRIYSCALCATEVWISRDSQDIVEGGAQVICRPCALKNMSDSDTVKVPPDALNTLSRYFGRRVTKEELDKYITQMRRAD